MFLIRLNIFLLLCLINIKFSNNACRKSFLVICDSVSDIQYDPKRTTWSELLIQKDSEMDRENEPSHQLTSRNLPINLKSNLKWLIINKQLVKIESRAFVCCKDLQQLILYGNNIKTVESLTFFGFRNLARLSFENNNLEEIKPKGFILSTIDIVDLSHNKLKELNSETFRKCVITTLRVTHNELWKLNPNSLPTKLKFLHLDHNILESIPQEIENLKQLQELTLSHNNIDTMGLLQLHSLEKLDLSFNKLTTISREFNTLENLKHLDLSSNNIDKIIFTPQFLQNIKGQFFLLLAHNQLTNLDLKPLAGAEVTVTLSGNPWNCKCVDQMLETVWNKNNNIMNTICDHIIISSGKNPYCVVGEGSRCSEKKVSATVLERFREATQDKVCDIFGDLEPFIKK